jgi:hypothetical protein
MIHITNKIYISYAESSVSEGSQDRLPEAYVQIIDRELTDMLHAIYDYKRIAYTKTMEELSEKYSSDQAMFDTFAEVIESKKSPKVTIFADDLAMVKFLCRWWKSLFSELTLDGAFALYKVYGDSEVLRSTKLTSFIDIAVKSNPITFNAIAKAYWGKSKEEFTAIFDASPAFILSDKVKEDCSLEFLLANYLMDPEFKLKEKLFTKLNSLYCKKLAHEISDLKRMTEEHLYLLTESDPLLAEGVALGETSLKDVLFKRAEYNFLSDTAIDNSMSGYYHLEKNYNLPKLASNLQTIDQKIHARIGLVNDFEVSNPCVALLASTRKRPEVTELLECELTGKNKFRLLNELLNKNRVNPYFVPAFKKALDNNLEITKEFKL